MSYDLAVWEGDRPANDVAAREEFKRLPAEQVEPTVRIDLYVDALPDGIQADARGGHVHLSMSWGDSDELSEQASRLAEEHGLNCYDPQHDRLRTPAGVPWKFQLTSAAALPLRDPDVEAVRRILARLDDNAFYAVLSRADGWYLQVGYGERAGTRPGWYAVERQEGSPDRHFRAEVTNVQDVVEAFDCFLRRDRTLAFRLSWSRYQW